MRRTRSALPLVLIAALAGLVLGIGPADAAPGATRPPSSSTRTWAPANLATITPGAQLVTEGAQCTGNFIFTDRTSVFIGYAAHCAGDGGTATDTNGCEAPSLPANGTVPVRIEGASKPGTLVYSSWAAMQRTGETDPDTCYHNDFALVRIDPADVGKVNPSIPHWGGPTGLNEEGTGLGETVHSYGSSGLRLGIRALSPKTGLSLGTDAGGWNHPTYTVTPGVLGDSGSAMLDSAGRATGVLSTLALTPLAGSNNHSDLASALRYLRANGGPRARLALGTKAFAPDRLPLAVGG